MDCFTLFPMVESPAAWNPGRVPSFGRNVLPAPCQHHQFIVEATSTFLMKRVCAVSFVQEGNLRSLQKTISVSAHWHQWQWTTGKPMAQRVKAFFVSRQSQEQDPTAGCGHETGHRRAAMRRSGPLRGAVHACHIRTPVPRCARLCHIAVPGGGPALARRPSALFRAGRAAASPLCRRCGSPLPTRRRSGSSGRSRPPPPGPRPRRPAAA